MRLVALALLLAACGSSDATGPCASPTGKARAVFTERTGGTCGPIQDRTVNLDAPDGFDGDCKPEDTYDGAACTETGRATCTATTGATVQMALVVGYDHGGSPTNGYFELYEYDAGGNITCESTYDLGFGG